MLSITDRLVNYLYPHSILQHNSHLDLQGRNVLVTGGTSGIGAGSKSYSSTTWRLSAKPQFHFPIATVAVTFAKYGANVYIAGRNSNAALKVLDSAKEASLRAGNYTHSQVFKYHRFDASLIKDCKRFSERMKGVFEDVGGLHFLVMCQGGMANGERKETAEGHEWSVVFPISSYFLFTTLVALTIVVLSLGSWHYMISPDTLRRCRFFPY